MKFSCEKALLQSAILTASRAVSPKSTIPALEGLLLEAEENGTVFLTGYNQETGIRSAIQADVSQPGSMVLPARLFGEIVRKLPDDMVLFQEEALKVHIACGYSEFDLLQTGIFYRCPNCGKPVEKEWKFCRYCGCKL